MPTVEQILQQAIQHFHAGNIKEACVCCESVLAFDGNQADALHLYGLVAHSNENKALAHQSLLKAIEVAPQEIQYRLSYARILISENQLDQASLHLINTDNLFPTSDQPALMLAQLSLQQDNIALAKHYFEQALVRNNHCLEALVQLGCIARIHNEYKTAITYFGAAIAFEPDNTTLLHDLSQCYIQNDQLDLAYQTLVKAHSLNPHNMEIIQDLCNIDYRQKNYENVIKRLQQFSPTELDTQLLLQLGDSFRLQDRSLPAIHIYEIILQQSPYDPIVLSAYSEALFQRQRYSLANNIAKRALLLQPDLLSAFTTNINSHLAQQQFKAADDCFSAQINNMPNSPEPWIIYCSALERANDINRAIEVGQQGLTQYPQNDALLVKLAICYRRNKTYDKALDLLTQLPPPEQPSYASTLAQFEFGKLYDATENVESAMQAFTLGNQLAYASWQNPAVQQTRYYQKINILKQYFIPSNYSAWHKHQDSLTSSDSPVFLVGFPRSGTTLLDQILDSHPAIQTLEEKPLINLIEEQINALPDDYPSALAELSAEQVKEFQRIYLDAVNDYVDIDSDKVELFIDKLPLNLAEAGLIHRIFPNAKFIFALRHPCDVCLSCFMQHFVYNPAMGNFTSLKDTVLAYCNLMELWQQYTDLLPLHVHPIRYEDLLHDFDKETKKLMQFLELNWTNELASFNETARKRYIQTPSYQQVSEPLYYSAKYRWHRYSEYLAPYLEQLMPFIRRYGYNS